LPHAHNFKPLAQRCAALPAANAGCALIAATANNDAKITFFISPSDPADRLARAPFFDIRQTKTLSVRFYDTPARQSK
jgi:hypothetical protein